MPHHAPFNPFTTYPARPTGIGDAALLEAQRQRQMLKGQYDREMEKKIEKLGAPGMAVGYDPRGKEAPWATEVGREKNAVRHLYGPLELLLC